MPIQSAIGVALAFRREATFGTIAANDATARSVPYVSHSLALSKSAIESQEIRPDFQVATMRHGNRGVSGEMQLQLQCGTYSPLMESALRRDFTAIAPITGLTVTATAVAPHFTRSAGSWIADGLAVGMCVRFSGFTAGAAVNNGRNFTITALTATQMTVAETVVAGSGGTGATVPGRVTFMPTSGHTQTSYTLEEWNPDVPRSNRFLGCRVNTMAIAAPPNDRSTLTFGFLGRDRAAAVGRYFTNAVTPAASPMQVGHNGILVVGGVTQGIVTGFTLNVTNSMEVGAVVGANVTPDVFHGRMQASGNVTCYFDNTTLDDVFDQETEVSLILRVTDDLTPASNFVQLCLPRIKLAGGSYSTSNQSRVQSFDFTALLASGAGNLPTTLIVQDGSLP